MQTWLIYALGGGWGHLTRALALSQIATPHHQIIILTNSPYATYIQQQSPTNHPNSTQQTQIIAIAPDTDTPTTCHQTRQLLSTITYNCLIIDTFPRGLGGELADLLPQLTTIPRILIHRDLNPTYIRAKNLQAFVTQHFDAVLIPGDGENLPLADLPIVQQTPPWLIRSPNQLPTLEQARSLLNLNSAHSSANSKTILVCASGQASELQLFGTLTAQLAKNFPTATVRCLSAVYPNHFPPELWVSHWPGIECLQAADVVVGGAGYNTVHECAALGVPLVTFAFKRLYDRQDRRAQQHSHWVKDVEEAIATVQTILNQSHPRPASPTYSNGAVLAVQQIEQAIATKRSEMFRKA